MPVSFSLVMIVRITEKNINPIPIKETHILANGSSNILIPPTISPYMC